MADDQTLKGLEAELAVAEQLGDSDRIAEAKLRLAPFKSASKKREAKESPRAGRRTTSRGRRTTEK